MNKVIAYSLSFFALTACKEPVSAALPVVKQSSSGICHDSSSPFYEKTKNYKSFHSLSACLEAGGRLPKSQTSQYDKAEKEAEEENRSRLRYWIC